MPNLTISDEQIIILAHQLPMDKKKELIDQLKFDEWLESDEAMKMKAQRENEVAAGKTLTLDQMKAKLRSNGKNI